MEKEDIKYLLILFLTSLLSFFSTLWVKGADLMEARNFITAREMVLNGTWLTPTLNGDYRFEKPPLPTWLTAFFMKIFNNTTSEYILRIPAALISMLLIFLMYKFMKILTKDKKLSFLVSFVLATTFALIKEGTTNNWDMFAYVFSFGTIVFLIDGFENRKNSSYIICSFFLGASIMSKGPVALYGIILPFIITYGYVYSCENYKKNIKKIFSTLILGVVIGSIWYLYMLLNHKDLFMSVMNKEMNTWENKHTQSIFFYLNYFVLTGPWIFFSLISLIYPWSKKKIRDKDKKIFKFGVVWTIFIILFLSVIKMKKQRYGIPIYIASSIGVGVILSYYWDKNWNNLKKLEKKLFISQNFLLIIISFLIPFLFLIKPFEKKIIIKIYIFIMIIISIILTFSFMYLFKNREKENFVKRIVISSGVLMLIINLTSTWFIERVVRNKQLEKNLNLSSLNKTKLPYDIYSETYQITDVWNVGKKINTLDFNKNNPEIFMLLDTSNKLNDIKFKSYEVIAKNKFNRYSDDNEKIFLYTLKKR